MGVTGEPSQLVLLQEIKGIDTGKKIRFLGCVDSYVGEDAELSLIDHFPATDSASPRVSVRVEHLLESLNSELLQTGSWLNIVGYVRAESIRTVEASMIWSAGSVKLDQYRAAAEAFKESRLQPG